MILLIRGPLGVGKTTVAKLLSARLNACYISVDSILDEYGLDKGKNGIPARNFIRANELALPTARDALATGQPVIFDGNFYYKTPIWHLRRSLPPPFFIFTLQAPVEVCIERDSGRALVYGPDSASWVHYLVSRFEAGIPIDTVGKSEIQVVEAILAHLNGSKP